ncbi:hypothetical protein IAI10_20785 [Clostridium sp. 19966]|uniref:hypothetical protein n=1 Tax=Clostridium sp. 19966 TaxID=2768166 RepID=UPI0028DDBC61|nr:hypothetical protein [Clostridium sp. 19966]MDT8719089.1 hypothetical protein [Clostridium sp. 19966]
MNNIERLKKIIKDKKWIQNDIGMGRIQCAKLCRINDDLVLIISSNISNTPTWARVEKMLYVNEEIVVFYDGEYCEKIPYDDYDEYSEYLDREEWNFIFDEDAANNLKDNDLVSKEDGFYIDIHQNIECYNGQYDEEESDKLNEAYNLIAYHG